MMQKQWKILQMFKLLMVILKSMVIHKYIYYIGNLELINHMLFELVLLQGIDIDYNVEKREIIFNFKINGR